MGLFDSQSNNDEFLWTAEALNQNIIVPGQMMEVSEITKTASGSGYILRCDLDSGESVYDFAYKKSKPGKTLSAMFDDPTCADGHMVQVKAQDKVKCAVCDSVEVKGLEWSLRMEEGRESIVPVKKKTATGRKDAG